MTRFILKKNFDFLKLSFHHSWNFQTSSLLRSGEKWEGKLNGKIGRKVRKRLLRVRGEDFQRRLHHSCLSIERTKESQQRVPLSLLFNYSPYSVSPFFLSYSCTSFCHMNRPQFELERKVEILLERIRRSGKMKYHRVLKKFFNL